MRGQGQNEVGPVFAWQMLGELLMCCRLGGIKCIKGNCHKGGKIYWQNVDV